MPDGTTPHISRPRTMDAIRFAAKGDAGVRSVGLPDLQPGHALVRIKASGLCHTDIEVLHGRYGTGAFPLTPGHEYVGVVEEVGSGVTSIKPGDRVAIDPNIPCGHCRSCRKGLTNLCATLQAYGVTRDGGFAEFGAVEADHLFPVGDLDFATAALAEPLGCVLNGLGAAGFLADKGRFENALIFGAGPIGMLLALTLKAEGVGSVAVADINDERLRMVSDFGLEAVHSGSQELSLRRRSFDFVADATGVPRVVEDLVFFTADGGTALVFGVCPPEAFISVAPFELFRRQIRLAGSHSLNRNIPDALGILGRDDGTMARLVTHRLPLSDILPFFGKGGVDARTMKVQFAAE